MKVPSWLKTYFHSMVGIAVALVIIGFSLNFLRTRGPQIVQGPAATAGGLIFGSRYNF